jgi:hypothetical protein
MRKGIGAVAVVVALSLGPWCLAEPVKEPAYSSARPLYAKLVLDEAGTKTLTLAFDESQGTGKGYDMVYPDLNLNGDLTDDATIRGKLEQNGPSTICSFPPIAVGVLYNEKAKGIEKPWELSILCYQFTRRRLFGLLPGETLRSGSLLGKLKLKDDAGKEWVYSFASPLEPAERLADVRPIAFRGKCTFQVDTKPDPRRKSNTGIAASLSLGETGFTCSKAGPPVKAHVEIKDKEGKAVHSEDVELGKMVFG